MSNNNLINFIQHTKYILHIYIWLLGPLYECLNNALRCYETNPEILESWGTCIAVLYSSIFKLQYLSKEGTVYRGVNETSLTLPPEFTGKILIYVYILFNIYIYNILHNVYIISYTKAVYNFV